MGCKPGWEQLSYELGGSEAGEMLSALSNKPSSKYPSRREVREKRVGVLRSWRVEKNKCLPPLPCARCSKYAVP